MFNLTGLTSRLRAAFLLLVLLFAATPGYAQFVPSNAVPIGRGPGVNGFGSASPGASGQCLISNGPSTAPSFQTCSLPSFNLVSIGGSGGASNIQCGANYQLGGTEFYTFSVGAASGFPTGCKYTFVNTNDPTSTSSRARKISINGLNDFRLWPGQAVTVQSGVGSAWQVYGRARYKLAISTTLHVNASTGNDGNDGLGTGSALQSVGVALGIVVGNEFDLNFENAPQVTVAFETDIAENIHYPGIPVAQSGNAAIVLDGQTHALAGPSNGQPAFACFDSTTVEFKNINISSGNSQGISALSGCRVRLEANVNFGAAPGAAQMFISEGASVTVDNDYSISAGAGWHVLTASGGRLNAQGRTISFSADAAYTQQFVLSQEYAIVNYLGATFTLNGHSVTGSRFNVSGGGMIETGTSGNLTFLPGSTAGSISQGGRYDGATSFDTLNLTAIPNAATTSALCINLGGGGIVSYNSTVGTCTVSVLKAKNLQGVLTARDGYDIVMGMQPYRYTMKKGLPTYAPGEQIGFVADFTKDQRLVARNPDGTPAGFRYEQYTAALTAAMQYMRTEIEQLKADNDDLRAVVRRRRR